MGCYHHISCPHLCLSAILSKTLHLRASPVKKKVEIAKRTQISMQAAINQKDMRTGNLVIKAIQTYSRIFYVHI